jgi:predicted metal-dependent TIM-barrel fold hydrolase
VRYIDHHAHMVSRTTDDYQQLALTGCVAVTEPAFWAGWDRSCGDSVEDYFRQLTEFEPKRAAAYGVQHYTWLAMNPKESDDRELSRDVLKRIPKFLDRPTVLGIGEIGMNRITRNEIATYTEQVELAIEHDQLILIHTPHLEDKLKGTRISIDVLTRYPELNPQRVMIDHAEEHTIEMIRDRGYWAGLTLYPQTKISPQRAGPCLDRVEELRLADERDLDRFGHSAPPVAIRQRLQEADVVDDGKGGRERADVVFLAERVDAVLHADARVVLREHGRRYANEPNPAVRGCRGEPHRIEYRAPAYRHDVRMPAEPRAVDGLDDAVGVTGIVLDRFPSGNDEHRRGEREPVAVRVAVRTDGRD